MANESISNNPISPNVQNLLGFFNSREDSFRIVNKSLASWSFNGGIPSKVYDVKIWDPTSFKFNVLPGDFVVVLDQLGEYVARPVIIVEPENPSEFFDITDDTVTKVDYTISGATAGASTVTYTTSSDHNFTTNTFITVSGIAPSQFNTTKTKITSVTNNTFTVSKTITGTYSNGGTAYAQAKFNSNIVIKYLNSYGLESDYIVETYIGTTGYPENYVEVIREDWANKYSGSAGWILSGSGNSIFNNVAVRGEITADTLDVGGEEGITYDGTTIRLGTDVTIAGSVTADSFFIDANNFWNTVGNLGSFRVGNATSYFYWNNATQSLSTTGQLTVGTNAIAINILGATSAAGTKIYSGTNSTFNDTGNTGFYIDASGRFSLGTTTNAAGLSWDGSTLAVKGAITATSGSFTGTVNITNGGSLVAGNTADGVTISNSGIFGYEQGTQVFSVPTSSSLTPTIANFKVIDTTIYSDGLDANLILGTRGFSGIISGGTIGTVTVDGSYTTATITGMTGATSLVLGQVITATSGTGTIPAGTIVKKINSSTSISVASLNTIVAGTVTNITGVGGYNIQVRGQDSGGASPATPAAIFTTINGVTTTATLNNGFYMDRTGKFRLAGANGSVSMDGSGNLSVSGIINATSGNFTSTVTIGNGATAGTLQVGTNASNYFKIDGTDTSTTTAIYTNGASYGVSGVWLDASGRFSLGTGLTYSSGNLSVTGAITASTGAIGGFTIEPTRLFTTEGTGITAGLTSGTSNFSFFAGADNKAGLNSKFSVTNAGALTATTATITGTINATAGFIGGSTNGWTIASNLLSNGNVGLFAPASTIGTGTISARTNAVTAVTASSPAVGSATYTATGHTFTTGNIVTITGASIAGYNGTFTITAVATNTFTVANSTTGAATFTSGLATSRNTITLTSPTITPTVGMDISGTNVAIDAYITAVSGTSSPFILTLSSSTLGNVSGTGTIANYAIYAGNTFANRAIAPFKVDYAGNLTATNANITGVINASSGYIGGINSGWSISSNSLTNDSGIYGAGLIATDAPVLQRNLAQNPDLSYSFQTNTYSGDITGYQSINRRIGTFNNNRSEASFAIAPFGYTLGSIIINGSPVRTSTFFSGTSGSNVITCTALDETVSMYPGMFVYGTGIAAGAKIASINGQIVQLTLTNTGTVTLGTTLTFLNPYTFTKTVTGTSGASTITVSPNNYGIIAGMRVTGTGIATGATVSSIAANVITLSAPNTGAVSGTATFFTENNPLVNHFGGFEFDTADVPYTFTAQNYVASAYFYVPAGSTLVGRTITLSVDSGATWTNGTATAATLVAGTWVRASTVITLTTAGAGAPNIVAKLSGASDANTSFKQILTANWMISEGSTLQSYFDENFPMGVNVGGYAIKYEKAFYSGTTFANSANASLQLGHGGNIYATTGKIGGLNVNSNRLYATNGNGDFVVGDIGSTGDYPEYGVKINFDNYWSQTTLRHKKYYTNAFQQPGVLFSLESTNGYFGFGGDGFSTLAGFNSAFSFGTEGVVNLGHVEDVDNGGLYKNVSALTSNYYNTDGISTGSTYIAQYDATSWILGPSVYVYNSFIVNGTVVRLSGVYNRTSTAASNMLIATNPLAEVYRSTASSQRWKNSIDDITGDLEASKLLSLPVRQFKFNNDYLGEEDKRFDTLVPGFVAEEVAEHYPIAAEMGEDGEVDDWNVRMLIPPMLKLIQDQNSKIKDLETRLAALES